MLVHFEDADAHFTGALEIHQRLTAPFFIALTRLERARMLLARRASGDLARAETDLHSAIDLARRFGFAVVETRASELLTSG
jgi:hypothetical protein